MFDLGPQIFELKDLFDSYRFEEAVPKLAQLGIDLRSRVAEIEQQRDLTSEEQSSYRGLDIQISRWFSTARYFNAIPLKPEFQEILDGVKRERRIPGPKYR